MIFKDGYDVITPEEKYLADCVKLEEMICPMQGCGKVMCNTSEVRLHISQSHGGKLVKCNKSRLYACPVKGCPRNVEAARQQFFPNVYSLKMHYRSVHGEKKFKCTKCSKMFGNHVVYTQHKYKCKQIYYCECGVWYTTRNALLMHAKRKQHKIIGLQEGEVNKSNNKPSVSPVAATIPGILLPSTQSHINFKINHEVQTNKAISDAPQKSIHLPRLLRILPKAIQQGNSVFEQEKPIIQQENYIQQKIQQETDARIFGIAKSEEMIKTLFDVKTVVTDKNSLNVTSSSSTYTSSEPCSDLVLKSNHSISTSPLPGNTVVDSIHNICMQSLPSPSFDQVKLGMHKRNKILLSSEEAPCVSLSTAILPDTNEEQKLKRSKVGKQVKERKLCGYTYLKEDRNFTKKGEDVFDEINVSAKNLADTFTQTSLSFKNIEDSCSLRKVCMDTQTQVNTYNFEKVPKKSTMDTQTQINYYNFNDSIKKSTMDTQTQIDSYTCIDIPKKSSMDTQTQINSSNFNDILKKLTMDTQTEINSYNFNDIPRKSMMDTQTQMDYSFNEYTTEEVLETSDFGIQTYCFNDNLFPVIDNETQTESVSTWLSNFTNMETQTNFPDCSDAIETNFNMEPLVLDKSVQLEDMISLNDNNDIILTESSNMSTQTIDVLRDPWLNDNLVCESSSTQTDYFENLDFMDIDFHLEKENNLSDNVTGYCNDALISGITNENVMQIKNNIETQTTISLYDLLDNSLIGNYFNVDKNMANIETQTADEFREIHGRTKNNIETQTDNF